MKQKDEPLLFGTKGERTQLKILDAAILSVAKNGFESTTVTTIAEIAKVNRGLIVHYFKNMRNLMKATYDKVVSFAIEYSTEFMASHLEIEDPIERYFHSTFGWMQKKPHYGQFIFILITRAQYHKDSQKPVTQIFTSGRARLEKLINEGVTSGRYVTETPVQNAYQIHSMMLGHLLIFILKQDDIETPRSLSIAYAKMHLKMK